MSFFVTEEFRMKQSLHLPYHFRVESVETHSNAAHIRQMITALAAHHSHLRSTQTQGQNGFWSYAATARPAQARQATAARDERCRCGRSEDDAPKQAAPLALRGAMLTTSRFEAHVARLMDLAATPEPWRALATICTRRSGRRWSRGCSLFSTLCGSCTRRSTILLRARFRCRRRRARSRQGTFVRGRTTSWCLQCAR
jgi:hypothetical protein